MQKASMIGALVLSAIVPGAGLLLVQKGVWFVIYLILYGIGFLLLFVLGLGIIVIIPVWFISCFHTFFAVRKHNKLASIS